MGGVKNMPKLDRLILTNGIEMFYLKNQNLFMTIL